MSIRFVFFLSLVSLPVSAWAHPLTDKGAEVLTQRIADYNALVTAPDWNAETFVDRVFPHATVEEKQWYRQNRLKYSLVRAGLPTIGPGLNFDALNIQNSKGESIGIVQIRQLRREIKIAINDQEITVSPGSSLRERDAAVRRALGYRDLSFWRFIIPEAHAGAWDSIQEGLASVGNAILSFLTFGQYKGGKQPASGGSGHSADDAGEGAGEEYATVQNPPLPLASGGANGKLCENAETFHKPMQQQHWANLQAGRKSQTFCLGAVKKFVCETLGTAKCKEADDGGGLMSIGPAYEPRWSGTAMAKNSAGEFIKLGYRQVSGYTPETAQANSIVIWKNCGARAKEGHIAVACKSSNGKNVFLSFDKHEKIACSEAIILMR